MINLIKNEFIKLMKKKSTYIFLIITFLFIILTNILYKHFYNGISYSVYYRDDAEFYSTVLRQLDPNNSEQVEEYVEIKTQLDVINLISKYGFDSWQANIIPSKVSSIIGLINRYTYIEKDEFALTDAKKKYDTFINALDSDNWRYFAELELEEVNLLLSEKQQFSIDNNLNSEGSTYDFKIYEIDKQILEWRLEKDISYANTFLNTALQNYSRSSRNIIYYEAESNHSYSDKLDYYDSLKEANINKYYIENNIRNIKDYDNRYILVNLLNEYELFILIFIIMISGSIVSDEFNKGTIKLLLIRPYSRLKILLAKFLTCLCMFILFIVFIFISQLLVGGIIQGFGSLNVPAVIYNYNTHNIETMSIIKYLIINICAKSPMFLLLITLAFTISTLFTNSALAIALPLLGYMVSSIINQLIAHALLKDIKAPLYFVTPNWDLTSYLFGGLPSFEPINLGFSILVCLSYFLIMIFISCFVFKKRNIKNV